MSADTPPKVDFYDATYKRFDDSIYHDIRRETWGWGGEDFGQNGWITAAEQDRFIERLSLSRATKLLDIACGSGGPTLRIAERSGASVLGIDIHQDGINAAMRQATARGLSASFQVLDASRPLPFEDAAFDAIMCIDAINHLPDRPRILAEWRRILKPGGRLLFTDPLIVTGPLTNEEIAIRSSIGFFLFVAPDTNDRLLAEAGFDLATKVDLSDALAQTAAAWRSARDRRKDDLIRIETAATFEGQQRFFEVAARIAREHRLSRFAYVATRR